MKTKKEIKERIKSIERKIKLNKADLKDPNILMGEVIDIQESIEELKLEKKILKWIIN